MANEYTAERLMRLGADCNRDNRGASALEIVQYAEAWEQERDALRAERDSYKYQLAEAMGEVPTPCEEVRDAEAHGFEPPYSEDLEKIGREMSQGMGVPNNLVDPEWLTHDSHEPPADLAPAQLVELQAPTTGGVFAIRRVDELPWHPGLRYRPALSASGLPLCSAEGLGPEPRYVFRNGDDNEYWTARRPTPTRKGLWQMPSGPWGYAPSTHRKPGPKSESLMEVWRD